MDENQKNKFKVQTGWDIFKLFLKIYWTTLSPMAKYQTQLVFEKEIIWFQSQMHLYKYSNVQLKFKQVLDASTNYSIWMTYDLWHLKTCDFLWTWGMIWSFYDRIGLDQNKI